MNYLHFQTCVCSFSTLFIKAALFGHCFPEMEGKSLPHSQEGDPVQEELLVMPNSDSWHLLSRFYLAGTRRSAFLHTVVSLPQSWVLGGTRNSFCICALWGTQRWNDLPKNTQLKSVGAGIQMSSHPHSKALRHSSSQHPLAFPRMSTPAPGGPIVASGTSVCVKSCSTGSKRMKTSNGSQTLLAWTHLFVTGTCSF